MSTANVALVRLIPLLLVSAAARAGDVRVTVTGVEPGAGAVRVAAFASARDFAENRPFGGVVAAPTAERVEALLEGLPAGAYAIAAYQDRDGDAALTKSWLGIPEEPYGFSNGARGVLGPPDFDAVRVPVGDAPLSLRVELE